MSVDAASTNDEDAVLESNDHGEEEGIPVMVNKTPEGHTVAAITMVPPVSRLLRDPESRFVFIGDSANLSFLQSIRRLVSSTVGSSPFVNEPPQHYLVEPRNDMNLQWSSALLVEKPSTDLATVLLEHYNWSTNCLLDVLDQHDTTVGIPEWLKAEPNITTPISAKYYLALAIGGQARDGNSDSLAKSYFDCGRYLTALHFTNLSTVMAVQCNLMVTIFQLGASQRNSAFMSLGQAIRASQAIGLHYEEVSKLFESEERQAREKVWKSLRIMDGFMSSSMGRPPSTFEMRHVLSKEGFSPVLGICLVIETILNKVYLKRVVSTEVVKELSELHRTWVELLPEGLRTDADDIRISTSLDDGQKPNLGLCYLRDAYYISIMLLTRPFLLEAVATTLKQQVAVSQTHSANMQAVLPDQALVYACVDSAKNIIESHCSISAYQTLPTTLPIIVNASFLAALVCGLAVFADLDQIYPLHECLGSAQATLKRFSKHDVVARRSLVIVEKLELACQSYVAKKAQLQRHSQKQLVYGLFGSFQTTAPNHNPSAMNQFETTGQPQLSTQGFPLAHSELEYSDHHGFNLTSLVNGRQSHEAVLQTSSMPTPPQTNVSHGYDHDFHSTAPNLDDIFASHLEINPQTLCFDSYRDNFPMFASLASDYE